MKKNIFYCVNCNYDTPHIRLANGLFECKDCKGEESIRGARKMKNQFKEIEVSNNDTISDVRLFYDLKKSEWSYLHKVMNTMVFEKKNKRIGGK